MISATIDGTSKGTFSTDCIFELDSLITDYRRLIDRLYEALNPIISSLGSPVNLDLNRTPEAETALRVVKDWVRHLIYTANPWKQESFMTTFLRAGLLAFALDRKNASEYIYRTRYTTSRPPPVFVRDQGMNLVMDFVIALHGIVPWSLQSGFIFVE